MNIFNFLKKLFKTSHKTVSEIETDPMKKFLIVGLIVAMAVSGVSCQTTYDAYGNARQTVDPGVAVVGVVAAGVIGHAIASNQQKKNYNTKKYHNSHYHHPARGYYDQYGNYCYY